ncbi:MAG: helix-turn-helix transcriptional regulator [bacterium]
MSLLGRMKYAPTSSSWNLTFSSRNTQYAIRNTIVNIESGENPNPTIETLQKIAKALEVSVEDLLK